MIDAEFLIMTQLGMDEKITIRNRSESIRTWEDKLKIYSTNKKDCKCQSFHHRKWCNHQGYLEWKNRFVITSVEDKKIKFLKDVDELKGDYNELVNLYGEKFVELMKNLSVVLENRDIFKSTIRLERLE